MNISKNTIEFKRFIVPYRIYGKGKICLLCINGAQQTMGVWRQFLSKFSKKYKVVLFDFPGQGNGKILTEPMRLSFLEQIECIEEVLKACESFNSLYIYGASWGAIMAAAYSAKHPDKVDKLILGSFAIRGNDNLTKIITEGLQLYDAGSPHKIADLLIDGFGDNIPSNLKSKIQRQFKEIPNDHFRCFYSHSEFVRSLKSIDSLIDFSKITAKCLIIYGKNDTICDLKDVEILSKTIPNAEMKTLNNVGHFLHFETPSVMEIYEDFYDSA